MTLSAPASPPPFDLERLASPETWAGWADQARDWLAAEIAAPNVALQLAAIVVAALSAALLARVVAPRLSEALENAGASRFAPRLRERIALIAPPLFVFTALAAAHAGLVAAERPAHVARIALSLAAAWGLIRVATHFIREPFWAGAARFVAWTGALLNIFGLLGPAIAALDAAALPIPDAHVSAWSVLRAAALFALLMALASWGASAARRVIAAAPGLQPSLKVLFGAIVQVALAATAVLMGLSALGIPLQAFAIFGGAVGVGLGFGLQKIVSNFISGIILLLDRSIKPGDVIEVSETYGAVNSLGLRHASVVTRDGHEHLIPNELLMTEKVVNWSYSSKAVRIRRAVGVAYGTDVHKAIALVVEAAQAGSRTIEKPETRCMLLGFGDNAVDLEVRFWIEDPENGVTAAANDVLLNIWDAFAANGVAFPFPQRDVHLNADGAVRVRVERED